MRISGELVVFAQVILHDYELLISRFIQGGERKRVSIAEMILTGSTIFSWDNSARGLDASSALDFTKSLRILAAIYGVTHFVSVYQASENIYKQFDKVLLLNEGRQVYYGPCTEAAAYFEALGFSRDPRQTTPDFLTGCTDSFARRVSSGDRAACYDADSLARSFIDSDHHLQLGREMRKYREDLSYCDATHKDFEEAHRVAKRRHVRDASAYMIPYHLQVWHLMRRQFHVKLQDKTSLSISWLTTFILAFVFGTLWLKLPQTSSGAFTRGGVLYISLLVNTGQAFGELGASMQGRSIINKHRAYAFYRPSALWISQILVDTTFTGLQILQFSLIGKRSSLGYWLVLP